MTADTNPMARYVETYAPRPEAFGGSGAPAQVNWSSIGSVSPEQARLFAAAILAAADEAEAMNSKAAS